MPVTAASFNILNGSQQFNSQLDTSLKYLSQDPQIAAQMQQVLDQAASMGKQVAIIDSSAPNASQWLSKSDLGQDLFGHSADGTPVIMLNLNSACLVWQTDPATGQNTVTGIQSAADAVYHELVGHGLNPNDDAQSQIVDHEYDHVNERVAVDAETAVNALLGEATRNNHNGIDIPVNDPTLHTITDEFGGLILTWMGPDGKAVYGPYVSPLTPDWSNFKAFGAQVKANVDATGSDTNHQNDPIPTPAPTPAPNNDPNGGTTTSGQHNGNGDTNSNHDNGTGIAGYDKDGNPIYNPPVPGSDPNAGGDPNSDPNTGGGGGDDEWDPGCVAVESYLPCGRVAGDIQAHHHMMLGNHQTFAVSEGEVTYSEAKWQPGFRIVTESGVSLRCSDTAPIPTKDHGYLRPEKLNGQIIPVGIEDNGQIIGRWERVIAVEPLGRIQVQHITVGDKCFWAGEQKGKYILHHNSKQGPGGGNYNPGDDPWGDPFKANKPGNNDHMTTNHGGHNEGMAALLASFGNMHPSVQTSNPGGESQDPMPPTHHVPVEVTGVPPVVDVIQLH